MLTKEDVGKIFTLRNGDKVIIDKIYDDGRTYPVHGTIYSEDSEDLYSFRLDGRFLAPEFGIQQNHTYDIMLSDIKENYALY